MSKYIYKVHIAFEEAGRSRRVLSNTMIRNEPFDGFGLAGLWLDQDWQITTYVGEKKWYIPPSQILLVEIV